MTKEAPQLGYDDVILGSKQLVFDGFFKINKFTLRHQRFNGELSEPVCREVFQRGDAVAVLPYDPVTDKVVLVEQFRIGAFASNSAGAQKKTPWLIECIAGMIDKDETPEQVVIREAVEEADITLDGLTPIMQYYTSPGGMSERVYLFAATVDSTKALGIHGLAEESEDIRVLTPALETAIKWMNNGLIDNATTIIALQWLQLNKHRWLEKGIKAD
jgi:ADP-ribose pyrophosphatase